MRLREVDPEDITRNCLVLRDGKLWEIYDIYVGERKTSFCGPKCCGDDPGFSRLYFEDLDGNKEEEAFFDTADETLQAVTTRDYDEIY